MSRSVHMSEMSWPEYEAKIKSGSIVFLPVGATEQHGPHMPLGVDVFIPTAIAQRVAEHFDGVVAPAIPYGYKSQPRSGGGEAFPGTTSLDAHTLSLVIRDVVRGLGRDGVRRIVIMPGHFENVWPTIEGIDLALQELRRDGISDVTVLRVEYWDCIRRSTLDNLFPDGFPGTELEHAALLETSAMLVVRPEPVDMTKVPNDGPARVPVFDRYPKPAGYFPPSGVLAPAARASVEYGQLLVEDYVSILSDAVAEGFDLAR